MAISRAAVAAVGSTLASSFDTAVAGAAPGSSQSSSGQASSGQSSSSQASTDASAIASLLEVEQAVALAYRVVLASGRLGRHALRRVRPLYAEELTHTRILSNELATLQPGASVGPPSIATAQQLFAAHHGKVSISSLRSERDALELLAGAESTAIGAGFKAMSELTTAQLLRTTAGMMASDAQHAAVIGQLLYPTDITRAIPDPFVQGT